MKVEVLYFPGCPNHAPAVEQLREVLAEEGVASDVREIEIADQSTAESLGFIGSPTIRIDGIDIEPLSETPAQAGFACRTYAAGYKRQGVPPEDLIRRAIRAARKRREP